MILELRVAVAFISHHICTGAGSSPADVPCNQTENERQRLPHCERQRPLSSSELLPALWTLTQPCAEWCEITC